MRENLIHHSRGVASYGCDGGEGRDIMSASSQDIETDLSFFRHLRSADTRVVSLLDSKPSPSLQSSIIKLQNVWESVQGNFGIFYAAKFDDLCEKLPDQVRQYCRRFNLDPDDIDSYAVEALKNDIARTLQFGKEVFEPDATLKFVLAHYPAGSAPIKNFHSWHTHVDMAKGDVTVQRSLNTDGMRFQFKTQAEPGVINGVSFATGIVGFKNTSDSFHSGPPVSISQDRTMYTITARPNKDVQLTL